MSKALLGPSGVEIVQGFLPVFIRAHSLKVPLLRKAAKVSFSVHRVNPMGGFRVGGSVVSAERDGFACTGLQLPERFVAAPQKRLEWMQPPPTHAGCNRDDSPPPGTQSPRLG